MKALDVSRDIAAPRSAVWEVLADFPNISEWNTGVKVSYATSEATGGVGATRHCDLAPMGVLEETIAEWVPEEKLVVRIDEFRKLPIKTALVTFALADDDGGTTPTSIHYEYEPSAAGKVMGPVLHKQLTKGMEGFLADLDAAATGSSAAQST